MLTKELSRFPAIRTYEAKLDGYRCLAAKHSSGYTPGNPFDAKPAELIRAAKELELEGLHRLTADDMKNCQRLKPRLVAQIEFTEWIADQHLRHANFVGLREDKRGAGNPSGIFSLIYRRAYQLSLETPVRL